MHKVMKMYKCAHFSWVRGCSEPLPVLQGTLLECVDCVVPLRANWCFTFTHIYILVEITLFDSIKSGKQTGQHKFAVYPPAHKLGERHPKTSMETRSMKTNHQGGHMMQASLLAGQFSFSYIHTHTHSAGIERYSCGISDRLQGETVALYANEAWRRDSAVWLKPWRELLWAIMSHTITLITPSFYCLY